MNRAAAASIGAFIIAAVVVAIANRPDPKATEREHSCKAWGVTDKAVLARCRESDEQQRAATAPLEHAAAQREIDRFNKDLSALAAGKTKANEADYPSLSIEDASKAAGGTLGMVSGPVNSMTFPAKGRSAKVVGLIVSHEPDPQDDPDQRTWEPRYFTLESETGWQRAATEKGGNPVMPTTINLDIESLNRHERQFIIDRCRPLWAAEPVSTLTAVISPCRATVRGHFDEIVGRREGEIRYVGIVADQADIAPLTSNAARSGMLSDRSLTGK